MTTCRVRSESSKFWLRSSKLIQDAHRMPSWSSRFLAVGSLWLAFATSHQAARLLPDALPAPVTVSSGWLMQDEARVDASADRVASVGFAPEILRATSVCRACDSERESGHRSWSERRRTAAALVGLDPGSGALVARVVSRDRAGHGAHDARQQRRVSRAAVRREQPAEHHSRELVPHVWYWYRTEIEIPAAYSRRRVWLTFDGINYLADVWVNGWKVGEIRGAFARGQFDITSRVTPGQRAAVAVLIHPPFTPADPLEQTQQWGWASTAACTRTTVRRSWRRKAGTGCPRSAIATWASGRRSRSRRAVPPCCAIPTS